MKRRLFTILSAISLLLFLAVVLLWLTTHRTPIYVFRATEGDSLYAFQSHAGRLTFICVWDWPFTERLGWARSSHAMSLNEPGLFRIGILCASPSIDNPPTPYRLRRLMGVEMLATSIRWMKWDKYFWKDDTYFRFADMLDGKWVNKSLIWNESKELRGVSVTYGSVAVVFGLIPFAWLSSSVTKSIRAARGGIGLCPSCGYDLRATPERCPAVPDSAGVENVRR